MPTLDKDLAERLITRVKTQKRPKIYCIVRYENRLLENTFNYAYCNSEASYQEVLNSCVVGNVDILWASKRFTKLRQKEQQELKGKEAASYP